MAFHIGYKNLFTDDGAIVTVSSESAGFEKENAYDGLGYDSWKPVSLAFSALTVDFAQEDKSADYVALFGHNLASHGAAFYVEYWTGSAWAVASDIIIPSSDTTQYIPFTTRSALKWKLVIYSPINLLLYSEQFENGVWQTLGTGTRQDNVKIAPDGTFTAANLLDNDVTVDEYEVKQVVTVADDSTNKTFSVYLKEGSAIETTIGCYFQGGGTPLQIEGTITWATNTIDTGTLTDEGGGWYRASLTLTNNSTGNTSAVCRIYPATKTAGLTGAVYAWGALLEQNPATLGYIKTEAAVNTSIPSISGVQIGDRLEMPNNAEVGFAVPTLAPTIKTKTARSESGAFIGGRQLSQGIDGNISFTNIDPAWVRSDWEPFIEYAQTPAVFVMAWDTVTYTDEIMLAWVSGDVPVPNYSSPLYMNFSLKFEGTK